MDTSTITDEDSHLVDGKGLRPTKLNWMERILLMMVERLTYYRTATKQQAGIYCGTLGCCTYQK